MIKTVLFDRDETLGFSDPAVYLEAAQHVQASYPAITARHVLQAMKAQWEQSDLGWQALRSHQDEEQFWQHYCQALAARIGIPLEGAQDLLHHFPYWRFLRAYAESRQVLEVLKSHGYTTAILSNTLPSMEPTLVALGIETLVDHAFSSCLLGVHKPELAAFEQVAARLGQAPEHILFVDDKLENVEAAQQAGMSALWIDRAGKHKDAIHDLHGVLAFLGL